MQNADPASSACIPLLAELVDAQLACGQDPDQTIGQLEACAEAHPSTYANALVALAKGRAGLGDPQAWLRDAFDGFTQAQLPLEASLCRLELAEACRDSDPELAVAEARAALRAFETLESSRHVDAASAVLRELGAEGRTAAVLGRPLTKRELEVARAARRGTVQPGDLPAAVHQPQDRRAPRRQHPGEARPAQPGRDRGVRRPAANPPSK